MEEHKALGANYRITIDGVTRANHDDRKCAIEIGKNLKDRNRGSDVKVHKIDDGSLVADIGWDNGKSFVRPAKA